MTLRGAKEEIMAKEKEALSQRHFHSGQEDTILLYSVAFIHLLPNDIVQRYKSLFLQNMKFVSSYLQKHIRKHVWDHDSNPKDDVYLQLVDCVYAYLLVCMWVCVSVSVFYTVLQKASGS